MLARRPSLHEGAHSGNEWVTLVLPARAICGEETTEAVQSGQLQYMYSTCEVLPHVHFDN